MPQSVIMMTIPTYGPIVSHEDKGVGSMLVNVASVQIYAVPISTVAKWDESCGIVSQGALSFKP